ncbi:hypothetical protein QQ008_09550 [Fulvivirgaceae bacterium BMA10]|uniref:Uncharacterized protein n=1 Tax=Splendidivirga corallicola TaxID=3051826 RepID=A0ABT8KLK7_9BACT|nr:hypothetical protein [Fulvivirgaceae bacterium BMA10]
MMVLSTVSSGAAIETKIHEASQLEATSDSNDEDGTREEFTFVAQEAIINIIHVDLHFESYFIHELPLVSEITYNVDFEEPLYDSYYFKTLFRLIIQPNAP